jgi:hypothetical protein
LLKGTRSKSLFSRRHLLAGSFSSIFALTATSARISLGGVALLVTDHTAMAQQGGNGGGNGGGKGGGNSGGKGGGNGGGNGTGGEAATGTAMAMAMATVMGMVAL